MAKAKYPLEALLDVRYYREDNAKKSLNNAKREKQEAEEEIIALQKELQAYQIWRVQEEDRRYEEILGTVRTLVELDALKVDIAKLMIQENRLEENIEKAKANLILKIEALEVAKTVLFNAQKDTMKICAHKDLWKIDAQKEEARLEDVEMEEFKPKQVNEFED